MPADLSRLPGKSFAQEPIHLQLAGLCREAINSGSYAPGDRFPSEREIADRFEVSRATANKVISTLVAEGHLELLKGVGAKVRKGKALFASLSGMESFTAHAKAQGCSPSTSVLEFQYLSSANVPNVVKAALCFQAEEEKVIYLKRLRMADDIPMILEHRWLPQSMAPGLKRKDVSDSFYLALEKRFGLQMTGEQHSISAVILDPEQCETFQAQIPTPALLVEGVGFVKERKPIWYQRLFYRGDYYQLHNQTMGATSSGVELRLNA
ncbi:MAG: GntR family transcriptional regulator [Verrucomicrobiota bacterium]